MANVTVEVPDELLRLLAQSKLAQRDEPARVRVALAMHLFLSGEVSVGRAAELAGERLADFERLLREVGLPLVVYDAGEYAADSQALEALERGRPGS